MVTLFNKLKNHQKQNLPFVIYAKPNSVNIEGIFQQDENQYFLEDVATSGFIFAPFIGKINIIPFKVSEVVSFEIKAPSFNLEVKKQPSNPKGKQQFEKLVVAGLLAIHEKKIEKVVLSRKIILDETIDTIATFKTILVAYPTAFRYLFFHPKIGLWMGASPEQLVKLEGKKFETVALAGTQLYSKNIVWKSKEKEEQQFVSDYILDKVKHKVKNIKVSDFKTVKAGDLAHLKTCISGELNTDFKSFDLVKALHPTPAICGLPKEEALRFILENENYDRKYYAGFLGEWNKANQSDLFVNLRCLEVENEKVNLYVGCGITKDSNPEKEFIETENKSMTMRNILVKKE